MGGETGLGAAGGHFVWDIRPEVFSFLPLPRWYGLMFVLGFAVGYYMVRHMFIRDGRKTDDLDRLLTYIVAGTVIGMRLGHCLFYEPDVYLREPWRIPMFWEGGYASHGGFLGVIIALVIWARRTPGQSFFWATDRISVATMFVAACIRIGNFFNSEIFGHPTDVPWAVIFKSADLIPRHPTQLYEAGGYLAVSAAGWALYLWTRAAATPGRILGSMIVGGFSWRFLMEFFKEDQVGFEKNLPLNMGQLLSIPFVLGGLLLVVGVIQRMLADRPARAA